MSARSSDMTRSDVFAEWFSALEAAGECMRIRLGCCASERARPEWHFLPHQEYDGIGGLQQVLSETRARRIEMPTTEELRPSRLRRIVSALRCLLRPRVRLASFLELNPSPSTPAAPPSAYAWALFSERDTRELRDYVRSRKLTMNAWMLWTLSQALQRRLASDGGQISWVVPINMRGVEVAVRETENQASTLDISFARDASSQEVDRLLREERRKLAHFGVWELLGWLARLGRAAIRRIAQSEARVRKHGSFSNLGNLRSIRPPLHGAPREWWMAFNPVLASRPVGAACLSYDGRLALTLQLHPSLSREPGEAHAWLLEWTRALFELRV